MAGKNKKSKADKKKGNGALARNRKAFHDFEILESMEAGIELRGTEVKSCRNGGISPVDAFVRIEKGEAILYNLNIAPYDHGNRFNHDPRRPRRLLLHKAEILKLAVKIKEKGYTIVPLKFYVTRGRVKVQLGIARGKTFGDKRETLRRKQDDMDARRAIGKYIG
jgi:SsrA-binding protein